MPEELHISSFIVHVRPETLAAAARRIECLNGAEIHQRLDTGKLIVTLETSGTHELLQRLDIINGLPGVISTALVYHQWEMASEAESEADHDSHAAQVSEG